MQNEPNQSAQAFAKRRQAADFAVVQQNPADVTEAAKAYADAQQRDDEAVAKGRAA